MNARINTAPSLAFVTFHANLLVLTLELWTERLGLS